MDCSARGLGFTTRRNKSARDMKLVYSIARGGTTAEAAARICACDDRKSRIMVCSEIDGMGN